VNSDKLLSQNSPNIGS